jgi:hypothetical protein
MVYKNPNQDGTMDTTLGLIFRLNRRWDDCDKYSLAGDYQKWNLILDSIWRNLLYRDEIETTKETDANGKERIIEIKLSEDDVKLWKKLNIPVIRAQDSIADARRRKHKKEYDDALKKLYQALQMKDVGLRKFQHKLKLYVKERSQNVSKSLFGGG